MTDSRVRGPSADIDNEILRVSNLKIDFARPGGASRRIVDDVGISIRPGEIMALVGESGSGKTLIGRSILGLLPTGMSIAAGEIYFDKSKLSSLGEVQMRSLRGARIGAVFQEPMVSLNPALSIGFQMAEALILHRHLSAEEARRRSLAMLKRVKIANPEQCLDSYPHQFSGGMCQRIMLASVMAVEPELLIADEPTTALDALIRNDVMDLMVEMTREIGAAVLLISHDLGMVAQYAQRVTVLRRGEVIETGSTAEILLTPKHAYTQALMGALPARTADAAADVAAEPMIDVRNLCVDFRRRGLAFGRTATTRAVDDVSLSIRKGEILAVVGESGSGKTTIARALMRLCGKASGEIRFEGIDLETLSRRSLAAFRTRMQMVFQDPFSSLDPRMKLGDIVAEGLRHISGISGPERTERACAMLEEVGLPAEYVSRYPHQLSGGQRQRVCIAGAIVAHPDFIVADEPVSALDVTIQHQILELLAKLQKKFKFTYLFISHDLGVVEQIADRVAVMCKGKLLEIGPRSAVYDRPQHPYTRRLLDATPRIKQQLNGSYALISSEANDVDPPEGYEFFNHGSVPHAPPSSGHPELVCVTEGHLVCCTKT